MKSLLCSVKTAYIQLTTINVENNKTSQPSPLLQLKVSDVSVSLWGRASVLQFQFFVKGTVPAPDSLCFLMLDSF